jgi:hypothetical protein
LGGLGHDYKQNKTKQNSILKRIILDYTHPLNIEKKSLIFIFLFVSPSLLFGRTEEDHRNHVILLNSRLDPQFDMNMRCVVETLDSRVVKDQ